MKRPILGLPSHSCCLNSAPVSSLMEEVMLLLIRFEIGFAPVFCPEPGALEVYTQSPPGHTSRGKAWRQPSGRIPARGTARRAPPCRILRAAILASCRFDVLVHAEEIGRIVLLLDHRQAVVVPL